MNCLACNWSGTIIDLDNSSELETLTKIRDELKLDIDIDDEIDKMLDFYERNGFDLVKIVTNGKYPLEKNWTNIIHKDKAEWRKWIDEGFNIGVKTGKISGITVVDIDQEALHKEFQIDTLTQKTNKGWHLFFKYEEDLPKTRIISLNTDIENDGGQVVIYPSKIDKVSRSFNDKEIIKMPEDIKEYIKSTLSKPSNKPNNWCVSVGLPEGAKITPIIEDGSRHHLFMHTGGLLRKQLNIKDTAYVLNVINSKLCNPPLSTNELTNVIKSLERYINVDDEDLAMKILDFLRNVGNATKSDIELAVKGHFTKGEDKTKLGKALHYLIKEEFIVKKGNNFIIMTKADWKDTYMSFVDKLPYKVPYFDDFATIRSGDMIVLGAASGLGKTHIAMNMIKQFIDQGIKPYYVSLECGSRFGIIAQNLGLKEGSFYWDNHYSPEHIELEKNAVTIIDWLLPGDYAATDKTYEHFSKQLTRKGGLLIVFSQLRSRGEQQGSFYAEDMVKFFASLVAKFYYDNSEKTHGEKSHFETVKIRESKTRQQNVTIPCIYNYETRELRKEV